MNEQTNMILYGDMVVPESALLKRKTKNRFGSVEGLYDSELADPDELEMQVFKQEFEPILALPVNETLDESVCKLALQIANARLWEDAEKTE